MTRSSKGQQVLADIEVRRIDNTLGWGAMRGMTCSVDGCDRPACTKFLCKKHYSRWRTTGDPNKTKTAPWGSIDRWLREHVLWDDPDECLAWPFGRTSRGYGSAGGSRLAHREMCALAHGPAPTGQGDVAHSCDNPICVNPHHLRWASHAENMADMVARNRSLRGARSAAAKLNDMSVAAIRAAPRGYGQATKLAREFGVSVATIYVVRSGKTWRHVANDV